LNHAIWNRQVHIQDKTLTGYLNSEISKLDDHTINCLPDLRVAKTLLLGSDYSGESPDSSYVVYSFLLSTLESWSAWEPKRLEIRRKHLANSRRISFKRLGDGQRRRALHPLLEAANSLNGLSLSIALNKNCESIFASGVPLDLSNPDFAVFRKWKPIVLEKAFIIVHIWGLLLEGLAAPGQNLMWFSDEDSIAANDDRVRELTQLFSWISSQYLTFNLGHCRCGTSKCDDGSRQIEDFLAIPDIIAGALAEQMLLRSEASTELSNVLFMHHGDFTDKTNEITWWLSDCRHPLKRLVCIVNPTADGKNHSLSFFHFHDQHDGMNKTNPSYTKS
jgi:hypothetical protein